MLEKFNQSQFSKLNSNDIIFVCGMVITILKYVQVSYLRIYNYYNYLKTLITHIKIEIS